MKMNKFSSFLVVLVLYNYLGMQNMPDIENASESTYSRYKFGIGLFHRRF
jgi:7-keto-8-aminopelargonate synthetase-like enzyme